MYGYTIIKALKDKNKELGNKLRKVIDERIAIEEKLADTNMPYQNICIYCVIKRILKKQKQS